MKYSTFLTIEPEALCKHANAALRYFPLAFLSAPGGVSIEVFDDTGKTLLGVISVDSDYGTLKFVPTA